MNLVAGASQHSSGSRSCGGFSLVDILVSLLLGSILSWASVEIYLAGVRSYFLKGEMSNIQNNGRYALAVLRRELMQVGFLGGTSSLALLKPEAVSRDCVAGGKWALDVAVPLDFVNDFGVAGGPAFGTAGGRAFNCIPAADVVPGTDIISIKRTAGDYSVRDGLYGNGVSARDKQWYLRLRGGEASAQWFYHSSGGFPAADLDRNLGTDLWQYHAGIYYIRRYSQELDDNTPALCVESLGGGGSAGVMATQCLAEGVEDMQLEFGIDSDADGVSDYFRDGMTRDELSQVVAVRVHLLMRSLSELSGNRTLRTYYLGRKQISSSDGFVRRVMTTTVATVNLAAVFG